MSVSNKGRAAATAPKFIPHRPEVDYGVLDDLLGYAIRRAQLIITEAFDGHMRVEGLTTQRFSAFVLISRNPGLKQIQLANIMGIARSGILAIIDSLEQLGLVERRRRPDDARSQAIYLTKKGARRLPEFEQRVRKHDMAISCELSETDLLSLRAMLERIRPC